MQLNKKQYILSIQRITHAVKQETTHIIAQKTTQKVFSAPRLTHPIYAFCERKITFSEKT